MTTEEKLKALELAISQIEKRFGKGAIMRLGESAGAVIAGVISTGSISLDIALGLGGIPRGRIAEIYGTESSGKTLWLYISLLKHKSRVVSPPILMWSMH